MKSKKQVPNKLGIEHKLYGTTTIGARGQVVIPANARKDLGLKPGDQLVVMGKFNKVLGFVKTEQLAEFIECIMNNVANIEGETKFKKDLGAKITKILKKNYN